MPNLAIKAEGLSKRYRLGSKNESHDTLMGSLSAWVKAPLENFRRLRGLSEFGDGDREADDVIWALRDASFEVAPGEVVGLIGRNGAGKSTLLKIVSRIVEPTSGRAVIDGRVSSLLEVGTGFHPDLTGRENIYLNGVVLGMSKAEMDRKFDAIVDFSGVEKFIDTPVKRYSSGMLVRLAFSVAAHIEPEILLVDEVLAVGDASFQKKCMGKMEEVAQGGRTILFVSHNLEAVRQLCRRALLFESGTMRADGGVEEVAEQYMSSLSDGTVNLDLKQHGLTIRRIVLRNQRGDATLTFRPGDDLIVEIHYDARRRIDAPYFAVGVRGLMGSCFAANMILDGHRPTALHGEGVLACRFRSLPLLPQMFSVRMSIWANDGREQLIPYQDVTTFTVTADLEDYGFRGEFQARAAAATPVIVPYEWQLPDGTVAAISLSQPME